MLLILILTQYFCLFVFVFQLSISINVLLIHHLSFNFLYIFNESEGNNKLSKKKVLKKFIFFNYLSTSFGVLLL